MKKILAIIGILYSAVVNAQPYLISFEGTGAFTTVTSVKVENLTAETSLTLTESQVLRLTGITDIKLIKDNKKSELMIYPNPMAGNSLMQFYPPSAENALITLFDMNGKCLTQIQSYLDNNLQQFMLSGISRGSYLISVKGNSYQYSGKLLSNGEANGAIKIEKISNNMKGADEKVSRFDSKGDIEIVDMAYTTGDLMKFTCTSGNYSTVITDIPTQDKTISIDFVACTDGDNNNYPVVAIGTQTWMAENLRTTHTSGGSLIASGIYDYNNNSSNAFIYGKLYTWSAIMAGASSSNNNPSGVTGVCPVGWHIPSQSEWLTLLYTLGGPSTAGGKLKEAGIALWNSPNTGATNSSGFSGLPGGFIGAALNFGNLGTTGYFWSSTEYLANNGYNMTLVNSGQNATVNYLFKTFGFSCRCVKD